MSSTTRSPGGIALANRLAWIDNLRTAMILLVVNMGSVAGEFGRKRARNGLRNGIPLPSVWQVGPETSKRLGKGSGAGDGIRTRDN